jgi:hypothetical protein
MEDSLRETEMARSISLRVVYKLRARYDLASANGALDPRKLVIDGSRAEVRRGYFMIGNLNYACLHMGSRAIRPDALR